MKAKAFYDSSYLCAKGLELSDPVIEGEDLGGADEGEVERVEEEHEVLSLEKINSEEGKFEIGLLDRLKRGSLFA